MRKRTDVLERGLLIGGKSVPASSGKLADDISPWDGEIYARVAAGTPADITRAADAARAASADGELHGLDQRRAHHRGQPAHRRWRDRGAERNAHQAGRARRRDPGMDIFASEIF